MAYYSWWAMRKYIPVSNSRLDGELVVGHSIPMSAFCYTIFRLDPYIGCEHSCTYCYTKFFPSLTPPVVKARVKFPKLFRKAIQEFKRAEIPIPPFRLSELTDGLQPLEKDLRLSLDTLRVCLDEQVPVMVSTKSTLVAEPPWIDVIKELAGEKLAYVQITVTVLDDEKARIIEPGAPPPSKRLEAAQRLTDEGIPVVLRLQPLIPYLTSSHEYLERYAETARQIGAVQVIAEVLRIRTLKTLTIFSRVMTPQDYRKLIDPNLWRKYPNSAHKHPPKTWRVKTYTTLRQELTKRKIHFTVCREGLYTLNTAPDCCGVYLLKNPVLRPTIREYIYGPHPKYTYITPQHLRKLSLANFRQKAIKHIELAEKLSKHLERLIDLID